MSVSQSAAAAYNPLFMYDEEQSQKASLKPTSLVLKEFYSKYIHCLARDTLLAPIKQKVFERKFGDLSKSYSEVNNYFPKFFDHAHDLWQAQWPILDGKRSEKAFDHLALQNQFLLQVIEKEIRFFNQTKRVVAAREESESHPKIHPLTYLLEGDYDSSFKKVVVDYFRAINPNDSLMTPINDWPFILSKDSIEDVFFHVNGFIEQDGLQPYQGDYFPLDLTHYAIRFGWQDTIANGIQSIADLTQQVDGVDEGGQPIQILRPTALLMSYGIACLLYNNRQMIEVLQNFVVQETNLWAIFVDYLISSSAEGTPNLSPLGICIKYAVLNNQLSILEIFRNSPPLTQKVGELSFRHPQFVRLNFFELAIAYDQLDVVKWIYEIEAFREVFEIPLQPNLQEERNKIIAYFFVSLIHAAKKVAHWFHGLIGDEDFFIRKYPFKGFLISTGPRIFSREVLTIKAFDILDELEGFSASMHEKITRGSLEMNLVHFLAGFAPKVFEEDHVRFNPLRILYWMEKRWEKYQTLFFEKDSQGKNFIELALKNQNYEVADWALKNSKFDNLKKEMDLGLLRNAIDDPKLSESAKGVFQTYLDDLDR